ncbi:SPARC-like protein [Camelus ferus]|nr:SPARC-like protein [Camelus ferus]
MLVTAERTAVPTVKAEDAENEKETAVSIEDHPNHKPEKSSILKSEEENYDQLADQDPSHGQNLGLQDQEESESDLPANLEYATTEGTLDLKEDMSEPEKETLPEITDFLGHDISSIVDSNQQESITKTEENQQQTTNDSHPQFNRSSKHSQDLNDQGREEQDPNIPNGEEEGEKEPGEVGTHKDNQEREREVPKEHPDSKQKEDITQSDDILEESNQPTQVSKVQKDEFEQGNQEQEEENSNAEMEEETVSKINKHDQDTEWQSQEGKPGLEVNSNHEETGKKTLFEPLLVEPTDDGNIMPRNHGADGDGDDGPRHNASDDYFTPSEAFLENERAQSNYYHIKYEEQREKAHENENVDTSAPVENQGAKKVESSLNEDDSSTEGNMRMHGVDFEVTQFPLRMRDWLKNILMQLYEPNPEHAGYLNEKQRNKVKKIYLDEKRLLAGDHSIDLLLRDFKKNYHMYVYPVHWQFSELDQHPRDRVLTHSELAPLRASLVPMEHCITRFFEECDPNKDKHITLKEWGLCFEIKEGKFIISPGRGVSSSPDKP